MTRQPVRELSGPASIIGVASPVSTYVRPADPAPSPLHGIAEGLASLSDGLGGLMAKRQKEAEDADKVKAEALFNENNQMGWSEAVRSGRVPANASPVFMRSYKEAQGALAGVQLRDKFYTAYASWEGRNSDNPEDFNKFYREFVSQNVDTTDVDILRGLNPYISTLTQESYSLRGTEMNKRTTEGRLSTSQALINSSIDAGVQSGEAAGKVDYDTLWKTIMAENEDAFNSGSSAQDLAKRLIQSITTKAVEHNDPGLLKLLDNTIPGMDVPLKDLQEGVESIQQAKSSMATTSRQAAMDEDKRAEKEAKAQETAATMELYRTLEGDPNADVEDLVRTIERTNPKIRGDLREIRKNIQDGPVENRADVLRMEADILEGRMTQKDILQAARDGRLQAENFSRLIKIEEDYVASRQRSGGILDSSSVKTYRTNITSRFQKEGDPLFQFLNDGTAVGMPEEAIQATNAFNMELLRWESENPNATGVEREKAVQEIGTSILNSINVAAENTDPNKFQTPEDTLKREQKEDPNFQSEAGKAVEATQDMPTEEDSKTVYDNPSEPPMVDTLPESYVKRFEERAAETGLSVEDINRAYWKLVRKKYFGEEPLDTLRPSDELVEPDEQGDIGFDDAIDAAYQSSGGGGEDQNADIRNLLMRIEGSSGDPNVTLANGLLTGGDVDLVNMNVQEVLALQDQMLAHPKNKWNSSAVGMPQVVAKTLRSLVDEGAVGMHDKFDEGTQTRIMDALLERRGLSKWRAGEMSDDEFIKELGDEWQSVAQGKASREEIIKALNSGRTREAGGPSLGGRGLMALVSSNKRGYQPDLKNLRPELADGVAKLQQSWGRDLPIVSGFRDANRNRKAKGAKKSQHIHGNAVDIDVSNLSKAERIDLIRMASEQGFKGIGVYANSLHLDYGSRRAWGPTYHDDSIPGWAQAVIAEHNGKA